MDVVLINLEFGSQLININSIVTVLEGEDVALEGLFLDLREQVLLCLRN